MDKPDTFGYADRAKSEDKDTPALPVRLHTKGVEALQHGECEANTNSTSGDNPTIGQRLSIHRRGEKAKQKDTLCIGLGSITYAMVTTRPNLSHTVWVVNRYMSNPGRKHWEAVKHILRYMRGTKDAQLTFGSNNSTEVEGYTNSDYTGNTDNRKST